MEFVQPLRDPKMIDDVRHVLKMKNTRNLLLFEVGIFLGLRVGDILNLKVKDLRGKVLFEIRTEKNEKPIRLTINPKLRDLVDEYTLRMDDEDYLFPSRKDRSKPISRQQAWEILNSAAEELGFSFRFGTHSMRKTMGYFMYQQTKDLELIRKLFNHSSQTVTRRYIGIDDDEINKAVNALPY